jgi:hypothetical protein
MTEDTNVWSGPIQKLPPFSGQLSTFKDHMPDRDAKAIQCDDALSCKSAFFLAVDIA